MLFLGKVFGASPGNMRCVCGGHLGSVIQNKQAILQRGSAVQGRPEWTLCDEISTADEEYKRCRRLFLFFLSQIKAVSPGSKFRGSKLTELAKPPKLICITSPNGTKAQPFLCTCLWNLLAMLHQVDHLQDNLTVQHKCTLT